ncbi:MAG: DUF309 domain-containing protein [Bacteriovoracaceae bacterium]|nr:DUF309 domain-containing protein [Bacteriovoracaceae bacterium]
MSQFSEYHLKQMKDGIDTFNAQKYWECHEALEHVWLEDRNDPVRNVYWAVIQVAAALFHYREKNIIGAASLINKAREKILRCENQHLESPLLYEKLDWKEFKELAFAVPDEPVLEDFLPFYNFRFKNYSL